MVHLNQAEMSIANRLRVARAINSVEV